MVTACRARYPGVRFLLADARELSAFSDGSFFLVLFSLNGLGMVLELHSLFRPAGWGREVAVAGKEALRWVFRAAQLIDMPIRPASAAPCRWKMIRATA